MKTLWIICLAIVTATAWGAVDKKKSSPRNPTAKPVPHERLQGVLPELPGWKRGEVHGETVLEETSISRVQVDYDKGESTLGFEIMDTLMNKDLLAELRPLIKAGYSDKRSDGYTKAIMIRGFPATEEWTNEAKNGYIAALVAERFIIKVTGSSVPNIEAIRMALEAVDFQKLAALK
jgi:hypothetical protein